MIILYIACLGVAIWPFVNWKYRHLINTINMLLLGIFFNSVYFYLFIISFILLSFHCYLSTEKKRKGKYF